MATLITKFDIGDIVWHAVTVTEKRQHTCPDCLGSRNWKAVSPSGGEFDVPCPRCTVNYQSDQSLSLAYTVMAPSARRLTVGQIKASTATGDDYDAGNSYMCLETGIGSGSIYREHDLFATEAEALSAAQIKADLTNQDPEFWVAKQYDKSVKFSDYELKDARTEAAISAARTARYAVGYLVDDLENADSLDEVKARIADWRDAPEPDLPAKILPPIARATQSPATEVGESA